MPALAAESEPICGQGRRRGEGRAAKAQAKSRRARRVQRPGRGIQALAPGARAEHTAVLADELLALCAPAAGQVVVDCTFGGGGHAAAIAQALGPEGYLIAIDRDPAAQERFGELAGSLACRTRFIQSGYAEALRSLLAEGVKADIIYFDLGISSLQLAHAERGFAYSYDAPLDMRMDPAQELSAAQVVNERSERELAAILREFGEERHANAIARAICRRRAERPLCSTQELVETISQALPAPARFGSGHPAKRAFQALRIAVNDELGQLDRALPAAWDLLADGGVLATIAFHSLEDRRAKRFMAARVRPCTCPPELPVCICGLQPEAELLTRRAIAPAAAELATNPRAASAHLRAVRKLNAQRPARAADAAATGAPARTGRRAGEMGGR